MPFVVTLPTLSFLRQTLVVKTRLSVHAAPIAVFLMVIAPRSKHSADPSCNSAFHHDHFESI
jgi:hypothetical protein